MKRLIVLFLLCSLAFGEVNTEVDNVSYEGDGSTTDFAFAFGIHATSELRVVIRTVATGAETLLVENTGYTVADDDADGDYTDGPGGTVTTTATYTSASEIHISRKPSLLQSADIDGTLYLRLAALEDALDQSTYQIQYLQSQLNRCIRIPETEEGVRDMNAPNSVDRVSSYAYFDADGDMTSVAATLSDNTVASNFWENVLGQANLADSVTELGGATAIRDAIHSYTDDVNNLTIELINNGYLVSANNAGDGDVELIKANTSDAPVLGDGALTYDTDAPTSDAMIANKKYVDDVNDLQSDEIQDVNDVVDGLEADMPGYDGTQVFATTHTAANTWQDLDVSAYVGSRKALCYFEVTADGAAGYAMRPPDHGSGTATNHFGGPNAAHHDSANGQFNYIVTMTDSSGIVEHATSNNGVTYTVKIIAFVPLE